MATPQTRKFPARVTDKTYQAGVTPGHAATHTAIDKQLQAMFDGMAAAGVLMPDNTIVPRLPTYIDLATLGVVADGVVGPNGLLVSGTDNAPVLMALREKLASVPFRSQPHYVLLSPTGSGKVAYSNNRMLYGLRSAKLDGNGSTWQVVLKPESEGNRDGMLTRPFGAGEMLQTNVLAYTGGKTYMNCPKIQTAWAGQSYIVVQNPADVADATIYFQGAGLTVASRETVFRGYPWGTRNYEKRNYMTGVNRTTGRIDLLYPLQNDHLATNPDYAGSSGGGSGVGRIIPLDHPLHPYPDYIEFANITALAATDDQEEGLVFCANQVVTTDCVFPQPCYPSENLQGFRTIRSKHGGAEYDKMCGDVESYDTDYTGHASNGGGCRSLTMVGGSAFDTFQPNFPNTYLEGVTFHADEMHEKLKNRTSPYEPALGAYAGAQPQYRYEIKDLRFAATPKSLAQRSIQLMPTLNYRIQVVQGNKIIVPWNGSHADDNFKLWKSLDKGFAMWRQDGGNGGRVLSLSYDSSYVTGGSQGSFVVELNVATPPVVGELWLWNWTETFIDHGGHQALDGRPLFYDDTVRFRNNLLAGNAKNFPLNFTGAQLKANGVIEIELHRFVNSVELQLNKAQADGLVKVTMIQPTRRVDLVRFNLSNTNARKIDRFGAFGLNMAGIKADAPNGYEEPGNDQYTPGFIGSFATTLEIYCGNIPATGFSDFSLLLDTRSY